MLVNAARRDTCAALRARSAGERQSPALACTNVLAGSEGPATRPALRSSDGVHALWAVLHANTDLHQKQYAYSKALEPTCSSRTLLYIHKAHCDVQLYP
jgi:hypothetical protein